MIDAPAIDGAPDMALDGPPPAFDCIARWKTGPLNLTAPVLVANVSSSAEDRDPFISNDQTRLTFASRRTDSQNGDVYIATRAGATEEFGNPVIDASSSSE